EDAVVDDDDLARAVGLGVRVQLGRPAVGRPARVADAGRARRGRAVQLLDQVAELARRTVDREPAVRERGDARRIVTAILESLQPLDQQRARLLRTDVPDDSAHKNEPHGLRRWAVGGRSTSNVLDSRFYSVFFALRRATHPSLLTWAERDSARAPGGTSSVTVV